MVIRRNKTETIILLILFSLFFSCVPFKKKVEIQDYKNYCIFDMDSISKIHSSKIRSRNLITYRKDNNGLKIITLGIQKTFVDLGVKIYKNGKGKDISNKIISYKHDNYIFFSINASELKYIELLFKEENNKFRIFIKKPYNLYILEKKANKWFLNINTPPDNYGFTK